MDDSKNCIECGKDSPYRCPTCNFRYCSVACCKIHKNNCQKPPVIEVPPENENDVTYLYPTEDTVSTERLSLLRDNEDLKKLLKDEYLRNVLKEINKQPKPERLLKYHMRDEAFSNFIDMVLNIVEPPKSDTND